MKEKEMKIKQTFRCSGDAQNLSKAWLRVAVAVVAKVFCYAI